MNAFRRIRPGDPPLIIAHRGDSSHAPENTLEAARLGHAGGAFAWELDVHVSRDGVPVVIHDETLTRTTNVAARFANDPRARDGFRVADFSWCEIRRLDAGSWFLDPAGGPRTAVDFGTLADLARDDRRRFASGEVHIPSLVEALELARILDWRVNVELKSFPEADPGLLAAALSAIDQTGTADRVLISSFDHEEVALAAKLRPEIASGALSETPLCRYSAYISQIVGADFLHTSASAMGAESRAYRRAPSSRNLRALDPGGPSIPTFVYTVNDARPDGLAAHLAGLGVAGIFSDDPAAIRTLWGRLF